MFTTVEFVSLGEREKHVGSRATTETWLFRLLTCAGHTMKLHAYLDRCIYIYVHTI